MFMYTVESTSVVQGDVADLNEQYNHLALVSFQMRVRCHIATYI